MPAIVPMAAAWVANGVLAVTGSTAIASAAGMAAMSLGFANGIGSALTPWTSVATIVLEDEE